MSAVLAGAKGSVARASYGGEWTSSKPSAKESSHKFFVMKSL
ncbi:hypothetical protein OnM2_055067 [Erysiphe neolycopersici]|uniref:Uncharacterized protein n=1 Tax=Erysiphe neolycopersici TaxID=212602 RepID=A0A420HR80_9PEZI|nr:hypothetical protein OnM2_055067 [Erysiphe neolycopersici]